MTKRYRLTSVNLNFDDMDIRRNRSKLIICESLDDNCYPIIICYWGDWFQQLATKEQKDEIQKLAELNHIWIDETDESTVSIFNLFDKEKIILDLTQKEKRQINQLEKLKQEIFAHPELSELQKQISEYENIIHNYYWFKNRI